jgi:uncharacterized protein
MIPSFEKCLELWDTYHLPKEKRVHVQVVAFVCHFFANHFNQKGIYIHTPRIIASALLHDLDKGAEKFPRERHPDAGIRILKALGMKDIAINVKTHSLHTILQKDINTYTWEQKILFLSDKMVKQTIVGVDKRFALWLAEPLSSQVKDQIRSAYPKVKILEKEICAVIGIHPKNIISEINAYNTLSFRLIK